MSKKSYAKRQPGELIDDPPQLVECRAGIRQPESGEALIQEVAKNKPCPKATGKDKARAVNDAYGKLEEFGEEYCRAGNKNCSGAVGCTPVLGEIFDVVYDSREEIDGDAKKCFVTVKLKCPISCRCVV